MSGEKNIYKPIGINAWKKQFQEGITEVGMVEQDPIFDNPEYDGSNVDRYRDIAVSALLNELAYRTDRNQRNPQEIDFKSDEERSRFESGDITPTEGIRLLMNQPQVESLELARLRHVGDWSGPDLVTRAVRHDIINDKEILKNTIDLSEISPSYYRITSFDVAVPELQNIIAVTRKREIFSHFDDTLVSVLADTYVIDASSKSIDPEVRERILEEFIKLDNIYRTSPSEADGWNHSHHNFVGVAINSLAKNRRKLVLPESYEDRNKININGVLPLTSAVYATTRKARCSYRERASE